MRGARAYREDWRAQLFAAHLGPAWRPAPDDAVRRRLAGRTILVTGASSGIGRATALALGRAGAEVVGLARRTAELSSLQAELAALEVSSTMITCDLRDPGAVGSALGQLAGIEVDTVVSNAGLSIHRSVAASVDRSHDLQRSTGTNLLGPAQLITGLLPAMRTRGHGQVINIGSVSALVPTAGWSAYAATKAGFDAWLRAVAAEVRGDGIRVSSIHFPLVLTPMVAAPPRHRWALTADQAAAVVLATLVRHPRQLCPWWARIAATTGIWAPQMIEGAPRR